MSNLLERNLILLHRSQDNEAINVFHSLVDSCYFVFERKKQGGFVRLETKRYCCNLPPEGLLLIRLTLNVHRLNREADVK
jgi:hypothetical protein